MECAPVWRRLIFFDITKVGDISLVVEAKKILFVVNVAEFFLSHRLPLAMAAQNKGYEVHVASATGAGVDEIRALGFAHHPVDFVRSGQNPVVELRTLARLFRLFRRLKPHVVHLITIKPVIYGGVAARLARIRGVVFAVSGLGTVFISDSVSAKLRKRLVTWLYSAAFKQKRLVVVFQNPDDRDTFLSSGAVKQADTRIIRGSGVALSDYPCLPEPLGLPVVAMACRLLKDKGVFEFVEAAHLLHERGLAIEMRLIGSPDPGNPSSVTEDDIELWRKSGVVKLLGYRSDIADQYAAANLVCLPSYREGLPKGLVEAAACGRAVVTTDVPGCRDAIIPDKTGLLVPVKSSFALADAIQHLIENESLRKKMAHAGRKLAEDAFAIEIIVDQHMRIYDELGRDV